MVGTSGGGDGVDGELAEGDGAGEEEGLAGEVEREGGEAGAGDEGGEDDVAGGDEFREEAGGCGEDQGRGRRWWGSRRRWWSRRCRRCRGVGGDGGGGGVAVGSGEVGGVDEGAAVGGEAFDEAVLGAAGAGDCWMAFGVTGRSEPKVMPVTKTASAVAAMAEAAMRLPPVKVTKTELRLGSNLATKELVEGRCGWGRRRRRFR